MSFTTAMFRRALTGALAISAGAAALPEAAIAQEVAEEASECRIMFTAFTSLAERINDQGFDPDNFDALCARLQAEGTGILIDSEAGSLDDRVVAWASIRVIRIDTEIGSTHSSTNTRIYTLTADEEAGEEIETLVQMTAINVALENLYANFDGHLTGLAEEEARLAALFAGAEI